MIQTCFHGTIYSIMSHAHSVLRSHARRGTRSASQQGTSTCRLVLLQKCNRELDEKKEAIIPNKLYFVLHRASSITLRPRRCSTVQWDATKVGTSSILTATRCSPSGLSRPEWLEFLFFSPFRCHIWKICDKPHC